jgi:hypothetical protein
MIKKVKNFFALGFGVESYSQADEFDLTIHYNTFHVKVYLGQYIWLFNIRGKKVEKI